MVYHGRIFTVTLHNIPLIKSMGLTAWYPSTFWRKATTDKIDADTNGPVRNDNDRINGYTGGWNENLTMIAFHLTPYVYFNSTTVTPYGVMVSESVLSAVILRQKMGG